MWRTVCQGLTAMKHLFFSGILLAILGLSACAKTEIPVVFDLVDGVVTTELFTDIPLEQHKQPGVTEVLLLEVGEAGTDPALGPLSAEGQNYAVAAGNYSLGFEPTDFFTANIPGHLWTITPSASLADTIPLPIPDGSTPEALADKLLQDYAGKRIVVTGEREYLTALGKQFSDGSFKKWPESDKPVMVFLTSGPEKSTVQIFGINLHRPE